MTAEITRPAARPATPSTTPAAPVWEHHDILDLDVFSVGDIPTQALLDLYTMRRHVGDLRGKRVVMVGDISYSRVARSDMWGLAAMGAQVVLCGPPTLLPRGLRPGDRPAHAESALPPVTIETN